MEQPRSIVLTVTVGVGGRPTNMAVDMQPSDFALGREHLLTEFLEPLCETLFMCYRELGGPNLPIDLSVEVNVDGRAKQIRPWRIRKGDFITGHAHVLKEYFEPMVEILTHAYGQLVQETQPGVREALEEREDISRRLAAIGMV